MLAKTTTVVAALALVPSAAAFFDCIYPKNSTPRVPAGACCDSVVKHTIFDIPFEYTGKNCKSPPPKREKKTCMTAYLHSTDPCGRDLYFDCKWNQKPACCEPLMMVPQAKSNPACKLPLVREEHSGPPVPCPDPNP
ncbi:hypothetical protein ISF_03076 [Cordyceps fumosorosea ARSEF 2679]|uniref:Uncharacterized protein n=1 Tax=Cordyceps fumosorosea (strain ARSEF 2679) TaxID=1081104 RepID=A0A168B9F6_CORFA|nr:hypothetical protein ISF_03076 [Cordyceps fumosorosea ARSEF 2679]OAA69806.1 hypothetical protein ISF_03076 [Cordyceps fumosorosea ARSEF 2679]